MHCRPIISKLALPIFDRKRVNPLFCTLITMRTTAIARSHGNHASNPNFLNFTHRIRRVRLPRKRCQSSSRGCRRNGAELAPNVFDDRRQKSPLHCQICFIFCIFTIHRICKHMQSISQSLRCARRLCCFGARRGSGSRNSTRQIFLNFAHRIRRV